MVDAASQRESDPVFDGYREWVNDALFKAKAEGDLILWLGEGRWLIASEEATDLFVVEINRAEIVRPT